ncbi:MAG TPA: DUF2933 domain-containing protein [Chloroflexia bacterium]|nr:DUF2933 domain-containing protein [Chloroflexia bacterium]
MRNGSKAIYFAGLAVLLLLLVAFVPNLGIATIPLIFLLACPIMMFFMMGGMHGASHNETQAPPRSDQSSANYDHNTQPVLPDRTELLSLEKEVAGLRSQLADLKARQTNEAGEETRPDTSALSEAEVVTPETDTSLKISR